MRILPYNAPVIKPELLFETPEPRFREPNLLVPGRKPVGAVVPTRNAVARYMLSTDGTLRNIGNSSGNMTNAGPTLTSGTPGQALKFDGTNDYCNAGNYAPVDFERTDPYTVVCQLRVKSGHNANMFVASKQNSTSPYRGWYVYLLYSSPGYKLYHTIRSSSVTQSYLSASTDDKISVDDWHTVVWTYDGNSDANTLGFYVDGVHYSDITIDRNTIVTGIKNSAAFNIGGRNNVGTAAPFAGDMAYLAVYPEEFSVGDGIGYSKDPYQDLVPA